AAGMSIFTLLFTRLAVISPQGGAGIIIHFHRTSTGTLKTIRSFWSLNNNQAERLYLSKNRLPRL
ncbi:MAG TPA: hypothetical protein PLY40_09695, partial [Bacillota bacterium]|nr:hypothetical protein [Bacillota bacterium]